MSVDESTPWRSRQGDQTVYFCSESCKSKFDSDPNEYEGAREES
jgi:YHS domain-containing protein